MSRLRKRKSAVALCVVLVAFAAFVHVVPTLPLAILTPLWLVFPCIAITLIRREAVCCDEQPASLLSFVISRGPPLTPAFA